MDKLNTNSSLEDIVAEANTVSQLDSMVAMVTVVSYSLLGTMIIRVEQLKRFFQSVKG